MAGPLPDRRARWPSGEIVVGAIVVAALVFGWIDRRSPALDPHRWPGYLLGLFGGIMMLLVLGFSLRKRAHVGRDPVGSVRWWYNAHVLLGLFGPVAVLYHARFGWGSINSSFAMGAMLLVVASGLVGRYLLRQGVRDRTKWDRVVAAARADLAQAPDEQAGACARHLRAVRRRAAIAALGDATMRLWHYLHIPLYMVLVVAVILHVYMAHAY